MMQDHLVYYPDSAPGITRMRRGKGFSYKAPDGTTIDDATQRARFEALAVPPAYENVWISPKTNGHLQATGRDAKSRKQYRYHPDWRAYREATKFDGLAAFGTALPAIRRYIRTNLQAEAGERDYAIAAVLALMDRLSLRIGTPEYARDNNAFGATTLRSRHLDLTDDGLRLRYTAKGGKLVKKQVKDKTLNRALGRLDDLPGAALVSWLGDDGTPWSVTSDAVNGRLFDITGNEALTAKTFRTWNGSVAALEVALSDGPVTIKDMTEAAADRLHNTPAIARKSYIHPAVIELSERDAASRQAITAKAPEVADLRNAERALLGLLG